jgi:uncharacterized protein (TIGR02001 family)
MNALQRLAGGAATAFALFALTAPAFAGGSIKDRPAEPRRCTLGANAALTSDYVFRGMSQSKEGPAVQGGFDATCGMFYAGVWGSSIDFDVGSSLELDLYAGIKGTVGRFAYDLGIIYYAYPNQLSGLRDVDYFEFKAGASTEVWKGGTLGGTVFFSPDYTGETGNVWTLEGSFAQVLPTIFGRVTPTFSALLGYQVSTDDKLAYKSLVTQDDSKYLYWNAGVTFGLDKNWSLDVRYWDTNINSPNASGCNKVDTLSCDERIVGTLKFTY